MCLNCCGVSREMTCQSNGAEQDILLMSIPRWCSFDVCSFMVFISALWKPPSSPLFIQTNCHSCFWKGKNRKSLLPYRSFPRKDLPNAECNKLSWGGLRLNHFWVTNMLLLQIQNKLSMRSPLWTGRVSRLFNGKENCIRFSAAHRLDPGTIQSLSPSLPQWDWTQAGRFVGCGI